MDTPLTPFGQMAQTFATQRNAFTNQDLSKTQKSEFLGKQIPTETRYLLGQIRLLSELDRVDPFSAFHRTRAQDPAYTRIADALGASIQQVNQAQGKINDDKDRLERLRREIARVRKVMKVDEDEKKAKAKGGDNGNSSSTGDEVQAQ
ncbi:MAG: hypothetical protein HC882_09860 [Acidobacteria bacterium]|nr:hypothetical protein [Acidobacteriota bacterium]